MPRSNPDFLPRYRKHKATGQDVVTLNGRNHYLGGHGSKESKAEYDRLHAQWPACGRRLTAAGALRNDHSPSSRVAQSPSPRSFALSMRTTSTAASATATGMQANHAPALNGRGVPR